MDEISLLGALKRGDPFQGLPDIRLIWQPPPANFDAALELESGGERIPVYLELKPRCSAVAIAQIAPWIRRVKTLRPGAAVALACPFLSPRAQQICIENDIDFIDLAGNISINVPGRIFLRRLGQTTRAPAEQSQRNLIRNPFSNRSSRVVRVLLQKPRPWRLKTLAEELQRESRENIIFGETSVRQKPSRTFVVDFATISRVLARLEEDLLVRRRGQEVFIPEPWRLLETWRAKYAERYRWRLRSSFLVSSPFGSDLANAAGSMPQARYAITGAAAATIAAPFVDLKTIDLFVPSVDESLPFRQLGPAGAEGRLRVIIAYDIGVFMYARREAGLSFVSPIQAYLDSYATGGRDRKQADYLLEKVIQPMWNSA